MNTYFYDENQVRYDLVSTNGKAPYNWLFIPGGPGGDSSYFYSLLNILDLPGNIWLIDLPGNGSNTVKDYDFDKWLDIFAPTIQRFSNPILVGHSFGGMFPLLFPRLETILKGFIILHSAPTLWLEEASEYAKQFKLPDLRPSMEEFTKCPTPETFKKALEMCSYYYFRKDFYEQGKDLLLKCPFEFLPSVWWQRKALEIQFDAKWIPQHVPTVIVSGTYDCIVPYTLFKNDKRFVRENIKLMHTLDGGHFSWLEDPNFIKKVFTDFYSEID